MNDLTAITTSELIAENARITDQLDMIAASPPGKYELAAKLLLRDRRAIRAELERRKAAEHVYCNGLTASQMFPDPDKVFRPR